MRRQEPRDSPNSTREFGPMDATIRESLLAAARTTTQCRDTERTHRADRPDSAEGGATDSIDDAVLGGSAGFAATSPMRLAVRLLSRPMLSVLVIDVREDALSNVVVRSAAVSAFRGTPADFAAVVVRSGPVLGEALSRRIHAAATIATTAAAPTPLQIRGPIGARAGVVPHHRHDPTLSG